MFWALLGFVIVVACVVRVLLRPHRDPAARAAWIAVILALPGAGVIAYLLLGETSIGRSRLARLARIRAALPRLDGAPGWEKVTTEPEIPDRYAPLFRVGTSVSGYEAVDGNRARLMRDSDAAIDAMIADIDAATRHVHLMFYIWLPDTNGLKMVAALKRAAARGVVCRAMVDDLGSRDLIRNACWKDMGAAGIRLARALKIGNPLLRVFDGRIDLRNHRKILVVDNRVTYCGSQNCADPAFLPKAKYAPWVDAVMRFEGPVVRQCQHLFARDWMENHDEDITEVLLEPVEAPGPGFVAQVVATGPTERPSAMSEMFETLLYTARHDLFVTTPYYVPNSALQSALCAAANRGVDTTVIFPARNDDLAVAATSRSYYHDLLAAGVKIHEYRNGLLHTKSLTMDGEITLIGSANMDRRSFDLNYENNILLRDREMTAEMRARQLEYLANSEAVRLDDVRAWGWPRRLWYNTVAIVGPVL